MKVLVLILLAMTSMLLPGSGGQISTVSPFPRQIRIFVVTLR